MTVPTVEDRIRSALREVAARVPESDDAASQFAIAVPRRRDHRWLAVAAAVVVLGLAASLVLANRDPGSSIPVTTEGARTLLRIEDEGAWWELRVVPRDDGDCVQLVESYEFTPRPPLACLGEGSFPLQATASSNAKTVVYGIHREAASFTGAIVEVATGDMQDAAIGDARAFLLLVDARSASGEVSALDEGGKVLDTARFEHGTAERPPKGVLGAEPLDYAFSRDGAIWAAGVDGTVVRVTDGTPRDGSGGPSASPDRRTVLFSENDWDGVFWNPMAVTVDDGAVSERLTFPTTWSPSGRRLAGGMPSDDASVTAVEIVGEGVVEQPVPLVLAESTETGNVRRLAWDGEERLLAMTRTFDGEASALWSLSATSPTAVQLEVDEGSVGADWVFAEVAASPGAFPVIRLLDGRAEWGVLRVDGATATFDGRGPLPVAAEGGASLDIDGDLYLDARTAEPDRYLLGDGRNLFELTRDGELTFLRSGVEGASAP